MLQIFKMQMIQLEMQYNKTIILGKIPDKLLTPLLFKLLKTGDLLLLYLVWYGLPILA